MQTGNQRWTSCTCLWILMFGAVLGSAEDMETPETAAKVSVKQSNSLEVLFFKGTLFHIKLNLFTADGMNYLFIHHRINYIRITASL